MAFDMAWAAGWIKWDWATRVKDKDLSWAENNLGRLTSKRRFPKVPKSSGFAWHLFVLFCWFFLLFLDANTFQNLMLICSYSRHSMLHYQCVTHSKHFQNGLKIGLSVITLKKIENLQQSDIAEYKDIYFLPWERTQNEVS